MIFYSIKSKEDFVSDGNWREATDLKRTYSPPKGLDMLKDAISREKETYEASVIEINKNIEILENKINKISKK